VHVNLWDKFIIAKGRECHFHKFYKENPLSLDKLFETIMNDIEEFYNNDRGVLGGANIKALYKKLKEEAEEQLEEDAY
jgi:translation initiation factor 2 alpha subunit (eIF-2alpha)